MLVLDNFIALLTASVPDPTSGYDETAAFELGIILEQKCLAAYPDPLRMFCHLISHQIIITRHWLVLILMYGRQPCSTNLTV